MRRLISLLTILFLFSSTCGASSFQAQFYQNSIKKQVLSYEDGKKYLDVILKYYPDLLPYFDRFRENDQLGSQVAYDYGSGVGLFSPLTLKYIKLAGDLRQLFELSRMRIVEIGGEGGGLCKILSILGFASYTIIDTAENLLLIKDHLSRLGVRNVKLINAKQLNHIRSYDLVIIHSDSLTVDKRQQENFLKKVVLPTPNGYVLHHSRLKSFGINAFSISEIVSLLYQNHRKGKVEPEKFLLGTSNHLVTWRPNQTAETVAPARKPLLTPSAHYQQENAITYHHSFGGGRLGDYLLTYLHAKWIAYKYQMPFLYQPFNLSDHFQFSQLDQRYNEAEFSFQHKVSIANECEIKRDCNSTLFSVPYFPNSLFEYTALQLFWLPFFQPDWDDPHFRAEVLESLQLIHPVDTLELPKDCLTVALHVRRGGGVDSPNEWKRVPLKFPPDEYYIKQLKRIAQIFKHARLYVYIFTDDPNPQELVDRYRQFFKTPRISFGCRTGANGPHMNILEDFCSLTKFDCLIRSESNFSVTAAKLARYRIEIAPAHCRWTPDQKCIIDQVDLTFSEH